MGKVVIRESRFYPTAAVLNAARAVANVEIAAFHRAVGMLVRPAEFTAPADRRAPEYRYLTMVSRLNQAKRTKAFARSETFLRMSPAIREQRYPGTAGIDLRSTLSVSAQVQAKLPQVNTPLLPNLPFFFLTSADAGKADRGGITSTQSRNVFFRLRKLTCVRMTNHTVFEPDPDSIDVAGAGIDHDGSVEQIGTVHAGADFTSGKEKSFGPPGQILAGFPVSDAGPWPKSYGAMLIMEERDDAMGGWLVNILQRAKEALESETGRSVRTEMDRSGSGRDSNGWMAVLRQIVQWISDELLGALGNDVFRPRTFSVDIPDRASLSADPITQTLRFQDHGGDYLMDVEIDRLPIRPDDGPPESARRVHQLQIAVRTGGDDLRERSHAFAVLKLRNGQQVEFDLNGGQNWGNNSERQITWNVQGAGARLQDLQSFGIRFHGGRRDFPFFDTEDHWMVDRVTVRYWGPDGEGLLLNATGTPMWRFDEGGKREWAYPLPPR